MQSNFTKEGGDGWGLRLLKIGQDKKVSAPSRGGKMGVRCQWSPGALGSCWTEEDIVSQGSRSRGGMFPYICGQRVFYVALKRN